MDYVYGFLVYAVPELTTTPASEVLSTIPNTPSSTITGMAASRVTDPLMNMPFLCAELLPLWLIILIVAIGTILCMLLAVACVTCLCCHCRGNKPVEKKYNVSAIDAAESGT